VRDGDGPDGALEEERLRVLDPRLAGGRVAGVPDGRVTAELLQRARVEDVCDEAHGLVQADFAVL